MSFREPRNSSGESLQRKAYSRLGNLFTRMPRAHVPGNLASAEQRTRKPHSHGSMAVRGRGIIRPAPVLSEYHLRDSSGVVLLVGYRAEGALLTFTPSCPREAKYAPKAISAVRMCRTWSAPLSGRSPPRKFRPKINPNTNSPA